MVRCGGLWGASVLLLASVAHAERPDIELNRDDSRSPAQPADVASHASQPQHPSPPRQVPFVLLANGAWHSGASATHAPFGADLLFVVGRRLYLGAGLVAATEPVRDRAHHNEGWIRPAVRVELHGAPERWIDPWLGFSGGPRIVYLNWYEGSKRYRETSVDLRAEAGLDFRIGSGSVRWIVGPSAYFGSDQERALVARAGVGFF